MNSGAERLVLKLGWIALGLALCAGTTQAQSYPDRPLRMIFGLTVGSSSDIGMRIIAQKLTEKWRQSVLVENKPGAGGNIAAEFVAKSLPNGYTLLLSNVSIAIAPSYYRKLGYDPLTEFATVTLVTTLPHCLCESGASSEIGAGLDRTRQGKTR